MGLHYFSMMLLAVLFLYWTWNFEKAWWCVSQTGMAFRWFYSTFDFGRCEGKILLILITTVFPSFSSRFLYHFGFQTFVDQLLEIPRNLRYTWNWELKARPFFLLYSMLAYTTNYTHIEPKDFWFEMAFFCRKTNLRPWTTWKRCGRNLKTFE